MTDREAEQKKIEVMPLGHASMILGWDGKYIYVDPVSGDKIKVPAADQGPQLDPDVILLTDIHFDHLDVDKLKEISKDKTVIVAPMAVADMLPASIPGELLVMKNGQKTNVAGFSIEAIPMYNIPESNKSFHTKGRGNGYVIENSEKRVYVSGDTSGIPEMRALKNIDMAFVAMNLPYTMGVEEAADAVLEFKPREVYPYHYRTPEGFSDIGKFKDLINKGEPDIKVIELKWY